ncbi:MAG: NUDIX hydrolase [Roseovarius sp.]|nr:NUDIX hydrolase [Roseovarius sp.]
MTRRKPSEGQISLEPGSKSDLRTQFAALCYRIREKKPEILMITSRATGRWIIPKGWPVDGCTPAETALREAWEEAGVTGRVAGPCLGLYSFRKVLPAGEEAPCVAMVYPVEVEALARAYPEGAKRRRKWMRRKKAADCVTDPELARILRAFDPAGRRG